VLQHQQFLAQQQRESATVKKAESPLTYPASNIFHRQPEPHNNYKTLKRLLKQKDKSQRTNNATRGSSSSRVEACECSTSASQTRTEAPYSSLRTTRVHKPLGQHAVVNQRQSVMQLWNFEMQRFESNTPMPSSMGDTLQCNESVRKTSSEVSPMPVLEPNFPKSIKVVDLTVGNVDCRESSSSSSVELRTSSIDEQAMDEDEVDVVGGVNLITGPATTKQQRKAHIEFYRKLKTLRNREKTLECQLCQAQVLNTDASIRSHVHFHSPSPLFVCRLCNAGFKDQHAIFEHVPRCRSAANRDREDRFLFDDRRDLNALSELLSSCFPRGVSKAKSCVTEMLDRLLEHTNEQRLKELTCHVCSRNINAQKGQLIRHLQSHPEYRCKKCKFVCGEESEQIKHGEQEHNDNQAYWACNNVDVTTSAFRRCFYDPYILDKLVDGSRGEESK